jgi:hypothetical protein
MTELKNGTRQYAIMCNMGCGLFACYGKNHVWYCTKCWIKYCETNKDIK